MRNEGNREEKSGTVYVSYPIYETTSSYRPGGKAERVNSPLSFVSVPIAVLLRYTFASATGLCVSVVVTLPFNTPCACTIRQPPRSSSKKQIPFNNYNFSFERYCKDCDIKKPLRSAAVFIDE
nr:hypothetical protein [Sediminibacterium soli]